MTYSFALQSICVALLLTARPRHVRKLIRRVLVRGFSLSQGSYYLDHESTLRNYESVPGPMPDPVPTITLPFGTTVTPAGEPRPSFPRLGIREDVPGSGIRVKRYRASDSVAQPDYVLSGGKIGLKGYKDRKDSTISPFGMADGDSRISGLGFEEVRLDEDEQIKETAFDGISRSSYSTSNDEEQNVEPVYAKVNKFRRKRSSKPATSTFVAIAEQETGRTEDTEATESRAIATGKKLSVSNDANMGNESQRASQNDSMDAGNFNPMDSPRSSSSDDEKEHRFLE